MPVMDGWEATEAVRAWEADNTTAAAAAAAATTAASLQPKVPLASHMMPYMMPEPYDLNVMMAGPPSSSVIGGGAGSSNMGPCTHHARAELVPGTSLQLAAPFIREGTCEDGVEAATPDGHTGVVGGDHADQQAAVAEEEDEEDDDPAGECEEIDMQARYALCLLEDLLRSVEPKHPCMHAWHHCRRCEFGAAIYVGGIRSD
jgi:hypothetical protein